VGLTLGRGSLAAGTGRLKQAGGPAAPVPAGGGQRVQVCPFMSTIPKGRNRWDGLWPFQSMWGSGGCSYIHDSHCHSLIGHTQPAHTQAEYARVIKPVFDKMQQKPVKIPLMALCTMRMMALTLFGGAATYIGYFIIIESEKYCKQCSLE